MKIDTLPAQFVPIKEVKLGSNILENVTAILSLRGNIPLLIGDGEPPRVWLYIPANKDGTEWYPLVKDNFSSHPQVQVKAGRKEIIIRTPEATILSAIRANKDRLVVERLDLRPFGINVYADRESLNVMGSKLSRNVFRNIKIVVGID